MRAQPFESAASELVDESAHPLEQLRVLDAKAQELEIAGDSDAVVECRIKQLALQRLLVFLYDFPVQAIILAQASLAEAYAKGGYRRQALNHLAGAREVILGSLHGDAQSQRAQVDILIAEGVLHLTEEHWDAARDSLSDAARLVREHCGELDPKAARVHTMLGQIAKQQGQHQRAADHFSSAFEVRESLDDADSEEALRLQLRAAEERHLSGSFDEGLEAQREVVQRLQRLGKYPELLMESAAQLARWLEQQGSDQEALEVLQEAETVVTEALGAEDAKAVEIKRDVALLYLKRGDHDTALQYLNDVHYYERRLHGSQSTSVARTLKALGTVHLVRRHLAEAEQCLQQALRIFEAEHPQNKAMIADIHAKLSNIDAMARGVA